VDDTPGDTIRRLQELLEQMIRESVEQGNFMERPMGFTIIIRGSGPFPLGQGGPGPGGGGTLEPASRSTKGRRR